MSKYVRKPNARSITQPERKAEVEKALREIFDSGIFDIDCHEQIELLIDKLKTSRTFITRAYNDWEKEQLPDTDESNVYIQAPLTKHRNNIVMIDGKPYRDITDYIIDCGAYYGP